MGVLTSIANVAETFSISFPTVVDSVLGRSDKRACDARLAAWAPRVLRHARVSLSVEGRQQVVGGQPYVLMSNHASFYDIPVVYAAFGGNLRMVAKAELFRVPLFGRAMHDAGFIEVDRQNRAAAVRSLSLAKHLLEEGTSLWIAPEGTRSTNGKLGPFKKGGFHLALQAELPILPVSLVGTFDIMPPHALATKRGAHVRAIFHAPLYTTAYLGEEEGGGRAALDRLMNDVRNAIAHGL